MFVDAGPNVTVPIGSNVPLQGNIPNATTISWTPSTGLSCTDCPYPLASPNSNTLYYVYVTDTNGCERFDSVMVYVEPTIYVPNAFTPNQDGMNDLFKAVVRGLDEFEWFIYDRWGQLVFTSTDPEAGWNGTYKGQRAPFDVYVWKIKYVASNQPGIIRTLVGHVTLVR
jgi:gliding motility-associated-like protein